MPVVDSKVVAQPAGNMSSLATEESPAIAGAHIYIVSSASIFVIAVPFCHGLATIKAGC